MIIVPKANPGLTSNSAAIRNLPEIKSLQESLVRLIDGLGLAPDR